MGIDSLRAEAEFAPLPHTPLFRAEHLQRRDGSPLPPFVIGRGEIVVIAGPSGAGKSTLLRQFAGLDPCERSERDGRVNTQGLDPCERDGRVNTQGLDPCERGDRTVHSASFFLEGIDVATLAPTVLRRRVGYVAQQAPMLPGTVAENLAAGLKLRGETLAPAAIAALLKRVHLPDISVQDAATCSGGERQRIALARALANGAELLLLDEPTAALDAANAHAIEALLAELVLRFGASPSGDSLVGLVPPERRIRELVPKDVAGIVLVSHAPGIVERLRELGAECKEYLLGASL